MKVTDVVSKIYDRNPISYRLLREGYREGGVKLSRVFLCLMVLPCIPFWNCMAKRDIQQVRKNGDVYSIRNGQVKFFLPNLELTHGEFIQNRIFLEQDYFEIKHLSKIKKYINNNAIILDVGANIGNHTVFFAKECRASKIYAFEPTQKTFQLLQKNIRINKLDDVVVAMNVALGAKNSKVNMIVNGQDAGSNRVEENVNGNIAMSTIDDLRLEEPIDFMKIDVEGYEYEVLKGAERTIAKDRPHIFIEIFDINYNKVHQLLSRFGYECIERIEQDYLYAPIKN